MLVCEHLITAATNLRDAVNSLTLSPPVTHVYNPLDYAWEAHKLYLTKYGNSKKKGSNVRHEPRGVVSLFAILS